MLLVHPDGEAAKATNADLNISFDPSPNYPGIARAASGDTFHAARVSEASKLEATLKEAISAVQGGTTAVVEVGISM